MSSIVTFRLGDIRPSTLLSERLDTKNNELPTKLK